MSIRKKFGTLPSLITVAGLALALAGCADGDMTSVMSTITSTVKVTVTDTSSPPTATAESLPGSTTEGAFATSAPAERWTMPNEIGKDLQRAQDDLQALTGNPMFVSTSEDLTGMGRQQIVDRNWQVCTSSPPPGALFTSQTNVVFGVVRDSETCP